MKEEVIERLKRTRGDDLERARRAFNGGDMSEQWGHVGQNKTADN